MFERATQTIEPPDYKCIALTYKLKCPFQSSSLSGCPTGSVSEYLGTADLL